MNTKQAQYQTDIARLAEDMAKRDAQKSERDFTARVLMITINLAAFAIAVTVLGIIN